DGLQSQEFEANAFLKTRDGEMFFGGINGFNSFYPQNIRASSFVPPVYLTEFQIFNKKIIPLEKGSPLKTHINFAREIILNYQQSTFSISFAALNYAAPNNNLYAYKLVGLDKQWNYVGSERKASYTNLDPGKYTFLVKASNNDGIWNNKISSIAIIIAPPFWKTWWFRLITAAFLFTSAWLALNFKRKLELDKLEEKKKDELHQIQLQFFTNISHEFRTPLTLILGRLEKLMKEDGPAAASTHFKSLSKNAARLMNLINELMDFRKIESGALPLKVSRGSIGLFIDEIADEFITAAYEKNLSVIVKKGHRHENVWFDRQLLEKILINLNHNSIKNTPEGGKITNRILEAEKKIVKSFE